MILSTLRVFFFECGGHINSGVFLGCVCNVAGRLQGKRCTCSHFWIFGTHRNLNERSGIGVKRKNGAHGAARDATLLLLAVATAPHPPPLLFALRPGVCLAHTFLDLHNALPQDSECASFQLQAFPQRYLSPRLLHASQSTHMAITSTHVTTGCPNFASLSRAKKCVRG